jgi:hypothetical protein
MSAWLDELNSIGQLVRTDSVLIKYINILCLIEDSEVPFSHDLLLQTVNGLVCFDDI